jgi:hypothetical protein
MPEISLTEKDAQSLACFLWFLDEWVSSSPDEIGQSLADFMGVIPYGTGALHHDLSHYRALLGDTTVPAAATPGNGEF